jgi:hypothetical protein
LTLVQAGLEKNGTQNIAVYWGKTFHYEKYSHHLTNKLSGQNSINQAGTPDAQKRLGYYCESKCSLSYYSYYVTTRGQRLIIMIILFICG